jgi:hypothetical protein
MTSDDDAYRKGVRENMCARPDPRRAARLSVPPECSRGELAHHRIHILNLSPLGARLAHEDLLHGELVCYLDLSLALGALRLTGRVAWTRLRGTEQTLIGERRAHYESGIEFLDPTPAQQLSLAAVLASLQATHARPGAPAGHPDAPPTDEREPSA